MICRSFGNSLVGLFDLLVVWMNKMHVCLYVDEAVVFADAWHISLYADDFFSVFPLYVRRNSGILRNWKCVF